MKVVINQSVDGMEIQYKYIFNGRGVEGPQHVNGGYPRRPIMVYPKRHVHHGMFSCPQLQLLKKVLTYKNLPSGLIDWANTNAFYDGLAGYPCSNC